MTGDPPLDLVILVPGKDDRETLDGLLKSRRESLGIRPVKYELLVHQHRDPGCFHEAPNVLQPFQRRARNALVMFDHEGSGLEERSRDDVIADLKGRISASGWGDRGEVILLEPELEIWVWSDSPNVDAVLGWTGHMPRLRDWMSEKGLWQTGEPKPKRPKESLIAALREVRMRRSSAIYRRLAEGVGLERCQDDEFQRLRILLRGWFPAAGSG